MSVEVTLNPLRFPLHSQARRGFCWSGRISPLLKKVDTARPYELRMTPYVGVYTPRGAGWKCVWPGLRLGWNLVNQSGFDFARFENEAPETLKAILEILSNRDPKSAKEELENLRVQVLVEPALNRRPRINIESEYGFSNFSFRKIKVAPSLLSADFLRLGEQLRMIASAGADLIHFDVMDGAFVPNSTFGLTVLESIRNWPVLPFDAHLMISDPLNYVERFAKAGAGIISFHVETITDMNGAPNLRSENEIRQTISRIKSNGVLPGLVLNPRTPVEFVKPYLGDVGLVLLMTVWPGFGGQSFIEDDQISSLARIRALRRMIEKAGVAVSIEVDGGIKPENAEAVRKAGAEVIVAGTAIFKATNPEQAIQQIRGD